MLLILVFLISLMGISMIYTVSNGSKVERFYFSHIFYFILFLLKPVNYLFVLGCNFINTLVMLTIRILFYTIMIIIFLIIKPLYILLLTVIKAVSRFYSNYFDIFIVYSFTL